MKRKHNEMSELSPKVEAKDMEFVLTRCAFSSVGTLAAASVPNATAKRHLAFG